MVSEEASLSEPPHLFGAAEGYDLVAKHYESWDWQTFWQLNEMPLIVEMARATNACSVLDVGVGTGRYLKAMRDLGMTGTGIDVSSEMLKIASQTLGTEEGLIRADVCGIPFVTSSFDLIITARTLSHVSDLPLAFAEITRVIRPGGHCIISDIDGAHQYNNTRISTPQGKVHIQTYKRTMDEVVSELQNNGLWECKQVRQLRANTLLWIPDPPKFQSIDRTGRIPVSFLILAKLIK